MQAELELHELELPGSEVMWLDGVVFAAVDGHGVWGALRDARGKLRTLGSKGAPRMVFVRAIDDDGRGVALLDPSASALIVGYQLEIVPAGPPPVAPIDLMARRGGLGPATTPPHVDAERNG